MSKNRLLIAVYSHIPFFVFWQEKSGRRSMSAGRQAEINLLLILAFFNGCQKRHNNFFEKLDSLLEALVVPAGGNDDRIQMRANNDYLSAEAPSKSDIIYAQIFSHFFVVQLPPIEPITIHVFV